jgi:hypothetical protein
MHELTSKVTFRNGAQPFLQGECVLVIFADPIRIDQGLDQDTSAGSASTLTPTATSSSPQHFAFIRSSVFLDNRSYEVNAYPIVSFSRSGGAIAGYNRLPPDDQARLIPLPPLWDERPTPAAFGSQFDLGDFSFNKNYWLLVNLHRFVMPDDRTVSLILFIPAAAHFLIWFAKVQAMGPQSPPDPQRDASDRCVSQHPPKSTSCCHQQREWTRRTFSQRI